MTMSEPSKENGPVRVRENLQAGENEIATQSGEEEPVSQIQFTDHALSSQRAISLVGWGGGLFIGLILWAIFFVWIAS